MSASSADAPAQEQNMEDMINMADIQKIMDESGPVVNTVLIQPPTAEGQKESIEQIELDMTPSKNKIVELMGGSVTILGQYNDIETVVLKLRNPGEEATENPHKLQPPLHSQTVFGPMLLVRMDESANPQNFAKEEYMEFLKKDIEPFEISEQPVGGANEEEEYEEEEDEEVDDEEGEGEGDEDDDSDGEDDENEMVHMMIMNAVMEKFKGQYGRDPTEKELTDIMSSLNERSEQGADEDEESEDEDYDNEQENQQEDNDAKVKSNTKDTRAAKRSSPDQTETDASSSKKQRR